MSYTDEEIIRAANMWLMSSGVPASSLVARIRGRKKEKTLIKYWFTYANGMDMIGYVSDIMLLPYTEKIAAENNKRRFDAVEEGARGRE